jgi:hypothetical protein
MTRPSWLGSQVNGGEISIAHLQHPFAAAASAQVCSRATRYVSMVNTCHIEWPSLVLSLLNNRLDSQPVIETDLVELGQSKVESDSCHLVQHGRGAFKK